MHYISEIFLSHRNPNKWYQAYGAGVVSVKPSALGLTTKRANTPTAIGVAVVELPISEMPVMRWIGFVDGGNHQCGVIRLEPEMF
jgi:hypothetical protein